MKEEMVSTLNHSLQNGPFKNLITVIQNPNGVYSIKLLTESNNSILLFNQLEQHTALYRSYISQLIKINQL